MTRYANSILAALLLAPLAACRQSEPAAVHAPGPQARKGVVEVEPIEAGRVVAGQTVYVPAYPSIYTADRADNFQLAVTLSIRNTDQNRPIIITAARYYNSDGLLVREYVKKPLRIQPMAAMEFFVKESDTRGGVSASFLVDWVAEQSVTAPVLESVMVGTLGTQGVSFISAGRVVSDRSQPRPVGE
jgi:Protein of unknown function (DUF3124)